MWHRFFRLFVILALIYNVASLPDEGIWDPTLTDNSPFIISKSLYKGSQMFVQVNCESSDPGNVTLKVWILKSPCWDYFETLKEANEGPQPAQANSSIIYSVNETFRCNDHIVLSNPKIDKEEKSLKRTDPIYSVQQDGIYVLIIQPTKPSVAEFKMHVHLEMKSHYGYLSAADWPFLPFYGVMCAYYVILGLAWMVLLFLNWRDLLRIQFWIGGVILLGMLEKATFYAEYQSINSSGKRFQGAMLFAEWVSCSKRTLARMLVIIVSLGFGIVKPRLGASLHRVVGVGVLYFFLAASEAYLRITQPKNQLNKDLLVASVPLAVLDSAICWWIFNALVNTTRTLRLRRNEVKLALYRHFTNTLIFAVIASVIYMLYSIKNHRLAACLKIWKDLWLDDAYWHILFSSLLLVIVILWRPTKNNVRYSFVPLMDTNEDDEEEQLVNDAYGVKVRMHQKPASPKANSVEEDIKWLEENVKSDPVISILDSDEELVNTRFEVSKMQ